MNLPLRKKLEDAADICGVPQEVIIHFIQEEWIHPIDVESYMLDEEDIARIQLINDLQEKFGINEEAVPVILHLIDQLHIYRSFLRTAKDL